MLVWVLLLGGLGLIISARVLLMLMRNAERRTRRALYRALSVDDVTIDDLLTRKGDAAEQLASWRVRGAVRSEAQAPDSDGGG